MQSSYKLMITVIKFVYYSWNEYKVNSYTFFKNMCIEFKQLEEHIVLISIRKFDIFFSINQHNISQLIIKTHYIYVLCLHIK